MESRQAYHQLRDRLDAMTAEAWAQYKNKMACKAGCSSCCRDDFRISLIEGLSVQDAVGELPVDQRSIIREQVQTGEKGKCPLLIDDRCSIYADRPVLCRIFGFPVTTGGVITTCELNFTEEQNHDFSALAFDKDMISRTLSTISRLLLAETGRTLPEGDDAPVFTIREVLAQN